VLGRLGAGICRRARTAPSFAPARAAACNAAPYPPTAYPLRGSTPRPLRAWQTRTFHLRAHLARLAGRPPPAHPHLPRLPFLPPSSTTLSPARSALRAGPHLMLCRCGLGVGGTSCAGCRAAWILAFLQRTEKNTWNSSARWPTYLPHHAPQRPGRRHCTAFPHYYYHYWWDSWHVKLQPPPIQRASDLR